MTANTEEPQEQSAIAPVSAGETADLSRKGGRSPYTDLLRISFISAGNGKSRCELEAGPHFHNMRGLLHGGATFSLVDTAMGASLADTLKPGEMSVTLEIQITYLRRVLDGRIECEARVLKRGRRVIFLEADVYQGEEVIAKATGTYAVTSS